MQKSQHHLPASAEKIRRPTIKGRPSAQASAQLTDAVLDASLTLFLESGFEKASIDELVSRVKISKKTLYSRFPSKGDLFRSVVCRFAQRHLQTLETETCSDGGIRQQLWVLTSHYLKQILSEDMVRLTRMTIGLSESYPELIGFMDETITEPIRQQVEWLLNDAVERNELQIQDTGQATRIFVSGAILSPLWALCFRSQSVTEHGQQQLLHNYIDFFCRGFSGTAATCDGSGRSDR